MGCTAPRPPRPFGGFAKGKLRRREADDLRRFRIETCRGEAAHWAQWIVISGFARWTPWPWALALPVCAAAPNRPCILLQRLNRLRLNQLLDRQDLLSVTARDIQQLPVVAATDRHKLLGWLTVNDIACQQNAAEV